MTSLGEYDTKRICWQRYVRLSCSGMYPESVARLWNWANKLGGRIHAHGDCCECTEWERVVRYIATNPYPHVWGFLPTDKILASYIGLNPRPFPWHLFDDLCVVLMKRRNGITSEKTIWFCGVSTRAYDIHVPLPHHGNVTRCCAIKKQSYIYKRYKHWCQ